MKMAAESSRARAKHDLGLDELLQKMQLSEVEREGFVLAKEEKENLPTVKWMAVAKLLTSKNYIEQSLISKMRAAWNIARKVSFLPGWKNMFMIQVFCLGDWKRIMEDGPWLF